MPYMNTKQAIHYNLNFPYLCSQWSTMFHLHPQSWNYWLETFHLPETMKVFSNLTPITKSRINPQKNKNQPSLAKSSTTNPHHT